MSCGHLLRQYNILVFSGKSANLYVNPGNDYLSVNKVSLLPTLRVSTVKYFRIMFRFRRDIRILKAQRCASHRVVGLLDGHHPMESFSAVYIIPRSQAPQCASYRGVKKTKYLKKLSGGHPTAESDSSVCISPRSQAPWCASHR